MFVDLDKVPRERPLLFVGNHTIYGVLDIPLLFAELYRAHGIILRSLGDHLHFRLPLWRDLLTMFGAVDGTPATCAALMRRGEPILVFPGGGREVAKRRGEAYTLIWKERLGFARLALQHGCTIVPFAAVGVEDAFTIRLDADDLLATPVGRWLASRGVRGDVIPPLATGVGLTPLPRPQRLYFKILDPIPTGPPSGPNTPTRARCVALRDQVRDAVERGLRDLRDTQRDDPRSVRWPRLFAR
jgi:1-acyl-sn-glycerol-3-phosphate acyltransferase